MKAPVYLSFFLSLTPVIAGVDLDLDAFGKSLGGWKDSDPLTVDYNLSGSNYRTYEPEITPTPDDGIFVSIRIDHLRGWIASNDHAVLEVSFGPDGTITSAQSTLAIQGRTISSDLIRVSADAGTSLTGAGQAVKVGTDLVANISAKILREKIVEAGRVSFPSALRHNYNLLYQAVMVHPVAVVVDPTKGEPVPDTEDDKPDEKAPKLEIKPFGVPGGKPK